VVLSLVAAAAAAVAALLLLFCARLAAVTAAARGGASRRCPWRGGETLSLSVTLREETEPGKGTANALMALCGLRSTSRRRSSDFHGEIRAERSTPSSW